MTSEQLSLLADQHGTPYYLFDLGELKSRLDYLRNKMPENVDLCYAIKANTFITQAAAKQAARLEVCSPGEFYICEKLGIPMEQLVISGVYKTPSFIEEIAVNHPNIGMYTVESLEQHRVLAEASNKAGRTLPVLLRLAGGSQFGMDESEVEMLVRDRETVPQLDIRGIQYFTGTQKTSLKRLAKELTRCDAFLWKLEQEYGFRSRELEYGTGFPVKYFSAEGWDEDEFLEGFAQLLRDLTYPCKVTLEIGRSIAASCGTYVSRVVDKKSSQGQNWAILDGGMNHLVYYGQSMAMKIPPHTHIGRGGGEEQPWTLCGALCSTNDLIVKQLPVTGLELGDLFAFHQTGAYSMTEGISLFLSRDLPAVLLADEEGEVRLVRPHSATYPLNTTVE